MKFPTLAAPKKRKPAVESNNHSGNGQHIIGDAAAAFKKSSLADESNTESGNGQRDVLVATRLKGRSPVEGSNISDGHNAPKQLLQSISVLTWNVWFGEHTYKHNGMISLSPESSNSFLMLRVFKKSPCHF